MEEENFSSSSLFHPLCLAGSGGGKEKYCRGLFLLFFISLRLPPTFFQGVEGEEEKQEKKSSCCSIEVANEKRKQHSPF